MLDRCHYHNVKYYTIAEATIFIQQNLYSAMHVELAYNYAKYEIIVYIVYNAIVIHSRRK